MQSIITGVLDVLRSNAMIDDADLDAGINAALHNAVAEAPALHVATNNAGASDKLEADPSPKRRRVERERSEPSEPDLDDPEASLEAVIAPTQRTQEGRRRTLMLSDSEE